LAVATSNISVAAQVTYPFVQIGSITQVGPEVVVSGLAGFHVPPGQPSQYHIQVRWVDPAGSLAYQKDNAETEAPHALGSNNYEFDFQDAKILNSGGTWSVNVRLYHQQPPGNDNQADAYVAISITVHSTTVTTSPPGLEVTVDGTTYSSPQMFSWLAGSSHTIGTFSPQAYFGVLYQWSSWSDGGAANHTVVAVADATYEAFFNAQYAVTIDQVGLDSSATGTVVVVNGLALTIHDLPCTFLVGSGSTLTYHYENFVSSTVLGKRFALASVAGEASPITVSGSGYIAGSYDPQHEITVSQTGVASDYRGAVVTIDDTSYGVSDLPTYFWWDENSVHSFAFQSPLAVSTDERYSWTSTSGLSSLQSDTISVMSAGNITGNYGTQYYLTVNTNPLQVLTLDPSAVSGQGWYDVGATAVTDAAQLVDKVASQSRYDFRSWDAASPTGIGNQATVTMDSSQVVTANYQLQHKVTFDQGGLDGSAIGTVLSIQIGPSPAMSKMLGDLPYAVWIDHETQIGYGYVSPVPSTSDGTRFILASLAGPSSPFSPSDATFIAGSYEMQYYLSVFSSHGTTGGQGWYDSGDNAYATVVPLTVPGSASVRYVFAYWSDDASGQTSPSTAITMDGPKTAVANWSTEYSVTFAQDGLDPTATGTIVTVDGLPLAASDLPHTIWAGNISSLTYYYESTVPSSDLGKRFQLDGIDGPASPVAASSATTIVGHYANQYRVKFDWTGLGSDAEGVVVTIVIGDTTYAKHQDDPFLDTWVEGGETLSYSFESIVSSTLIGRRYALGEVTGSFASVSHDFGAITSPVVVVATYRAQYHITFDHSGPGVDYSGATSIIDGVEYGALPESFWWDEGSSHSFEFYSPLAVGIDKRYVWTSTEGLSVLQGGSVTVESPGTVSASYEMQYLVLFSVSPPMGGTTTPSGGGWYDFGAEIAISATANLGYAFSTWTVNNPSFLVTDPSSAFTAVVVSGAGAVSANFIPVLVSVTIASTPQGFNFVRVDGYMVMTPATFYWEAGTTHILEAVSPVGGSAGTRYIWTGWSNGRPQTHTYVTPGTPEIVVASYRTQYYLDVDNGGYGVATGEGWYYEGEEASVLISPVIFRDHASRAEYAFDGWAGSGSGSHYTGPDNPATVVMTGPAQEIARWRASAYYLSVVSEYGDPYGSGWYAPNSQARFGVLTSVDLGNYTTVAFVAWSGDAETSETEGSLVITEPSEVVASWEVRYLVTFNTTLPDGKTLQIPGIPETTLEETNIFAAFYARGSSIRVGPAPDLVDEGSTRYFFQGWVLDGELLGSNPDVSFVVRWPHQVKALYGTEFPLTVYAIGVSDPFNATLLLGTSPFVTHDLTPESPVREWFGEGAHVVLAVSTPNKIGHGEWAAFLEWSGDAYGRNTTVSLTVTDATVVNVVFAKVNPVAESIPFSTLGGLIAMSLLYAESRRHKNSAKVEQESETLEYESVAYPALRGLVVSAVSLIVSAAVSVRLAVGYGISPTELFDLSNWAVVFVLGEALAFLLFMSAIARRAVINSIESGHRKNP